MLRTSGAGGELRGPADRQNHQASRAPGAGEQPPSASIRLEAGGRCLLHGVRAAQVMFSAERRGEDAAG